MRERREIVRLWQQGDAAVLVTLVAVQGSSYRRVGAKLLITRDGTYAGAVSGGCLEATIVRQASWKVRHGPVVERYSSSIDDLADGRAVSGCGGTIDLLFEPVDSPECLALFQALESSLKGAAFCVTTRLPLEGSVLQRRVVTAPEKNFSFSDPSEDHTPAETIYNEAVLPPQRLVLMGAGDDAIRMEQMAAMLGWEVMIVDPRTRLATRRRFALAGILSDGSHSLRAGDAVVILSHNYDLDRQFLVCALQQEPRYIGLLGSRRRNALLVADTATELGWTLEQICDRISAPIGLDLGGDGADDIALATLAEIQGILHEKPSRSGKLTAAYIQQQFRSGDLQGLRHSCTM